VKQLGGSFFALMKQLWGVVFFRFNEVIERLGVDGHVSRSLEVGILGNYSPERSPTLSQFKGGKGTLIFPNLLQLKQIVPSYCNSGVSKSCGVSFSQGSAKSNFDMTFPILELVRSLLLPFSVMHVQHVKFLYNCSSRNPISYLFKAWTSK
jgi:hypothetical protein